MSRKLIRGGRVIDPANGIDAIADVWIQDGRIDAITSVREESDADIDWRDTEIINASGKIVCPGFIDTHVSLREPGYEEDESTATGTAAALAGGFTTIAAQSDTCPVVDNRSAAEFIRLQAERARNCREPFHWFCNPAHAIRHWIHDDLSGQLVQSNGQDVHSHRKNRRRQDPFP